MSQIPRSHQLAHRAVLAVSNILGQVGALSETIKNDYGEDLIVQTSHRENADNFTLFIQVKGTERALSADGSLSIPIDFNHLNRWASHSQPILVCLYSDLSGKIYAFYPREYIILWEIGTSKRKSKTIRLSANDEFTAENAGKFIWNCRIEHYARMLAWHESHIAYTAGSPSFSRRVIYAERELNLIALRFLQDVGAVDGDDLQSGFRQMVENASRAFERDRDQGASNGLLPVDAISLALLGQVDDVSSGSGLPTILLERCSHLLVVFFKRQHPNDWRRISGRFPAAEDKTLL